MLILLALPFVFFVSNRKPTRDHNIVDRGIVWVSAPIQWAVVGIADGVSSVWHRYIALMGVEEDNVRLRRENARLREQLAEREEQGLENERLRSVLSVRERSPEVASIFAEVIGTSVSPLFRSIRVNRGTSDGVHLGAAVVNHEGVVGRVAGIAHSTADVMLLVDANQSVDVIVQRTRARARLYGTGRDGQLGLQVRYLARTADVAPGDVLVTSGTGSIFPKGLPVGTVVAVEKGAFGLYQSAVVEPTVDFGRVEEVLLIPDGWPRSTSFERSPDEKPRKREGVIAAPSSGLAKPPAQEEPSDSSAALPKPLGEDIAEGQDVIAEDGEP